MNKNDIDIYEKLSGQSISVYEEDDDMPFNSDLVFIFSQYIQCFEKLRVDNVIQIHGYWY